LSYQNDINQLPLGTLTLHPSGNVNALRPYPGYADIYQYITGANFIYNSLQVQLRKQFRQGGLLNVAYTWSKARTDANGFNYQPMDSYNLRGDWGPSSYNRNQIFVVSYVYPLPFWLNGQNWYQKVLGGWQVSGVTTIQSGLPFNVTVPGDPAGIGISNSERPALLNTNWHGASRTQYLDPAAFGIAPAGTFGNVGAYALFYPLYNDWDVSLTKSFPIGEKVSAKFRAELYDFPNHMSYTTISSQVGNSNFGQITGATDPRTLQLALRLSF